MFWRLFSKFPMFIRIQENELLLFHEGSGRTHCFTNDLSVEIVRLFFSQPKAKFSCHELKSLFRTEELEKILLDLSRANIIEEIAGD